MTRSHDKGLLLEEVDGRSIVRACYDEYHWSFYETMFILRHAFRANRYFRAIFKLFKTFRIWPQVEFLFTCAILPVDYDLDLFGP